MLSSYSPETCTCPSTTTCYHILACRMSLGLAVEDKRSAVNLTRLRIYVQKHVEKKCGRKRPNLPLGRHCWGPSYPLVRMGDNGWWCVWLIHTDTDFDWILPNSLSVFLCCLRDFMISQRFLWKIQWEFRSITFVCSWPSPFAAPTLSPLPTNFRDCVLLL